MICSTPLSGVASWGSRVSAKSAEVANRFNELPNETQEFLSQLRADDLELIKDGLFMLRNAFPNNTKHNASSKVDLPDPFSPTISVFCSLLRFSSVQ
jgi:hypothetical protein